MKSLHMKLAIGLLVVFGLLIAGFVLYEPLWFRWQEQYLTSDDPRVREASVRTIAEKGDAAIPYIRQWLGSDSEPLAVGACAIAAGTELNTWVILKDDVNKLLDGPPSPVTDAAAAVMFEKQDIELLDILRWTISFKITDEKRPDYRNICIFALKRNKSVDERRLAAEILGKIRDKWANEALVAALKDKSPKVRSTAAWAIGGINLVWAVEPLIEALSDTFSDVRWRAAEALGRLDDDRAILPLISLLEDPVAEVCRHAVYALHRIPDMRAVDPLIKALDHPDIYVVVGAVQALGRIGDRRAIVHMARMLDRPNNNLRRVALSSLGDMKDSLVTPYILPFLKDYDPATAIRTLELNGNNDSIGAPIILPPLKEYDQATQETAIRALGFKGNTEAVERLIELLSSGDPENLMATVWALGEIGDMRAARPLVTILEKTREKMQAVTMYALKKITGQDFRFNAAEWRKWLD